MFAQVQTPSPSGFAACLKPVATPLYGRARPLEKRVQPAAHFAIGSISVKRRTSTAFRLLGHRQHAL